MGAEIQRLQRKKRNAWQRVTNAFMMTFADPKCEKCDGVGMFTVSDAEQTREVPTMCDCTDPRFKKAYTGRLRRMQNGRLEFRPMAVAGALDE